MTWNDLLMLLTYLLFFIVYAPVSTRELFSTMPVTSARGLRLIVSPASKVGVSLMAFQQLGGINVLGLYTSYIFSSADTNHIIRGPSRG